MPTDTDLNLLFALNALLSEGSVAKAAERLGLSESAMSRALARLRESTGDELLVRAGRAMVLTPHALALRDRARELVQESRAVLHPAGADLDPRTLQHLFTIRANDGFIEGFAHQLVARAAHEAPAVRLRFAPKPNKDVRPLREGLIDLDIGVLGESGPEVRVQALFRDHFVAVVREGHPLLAAPGITVERYAACDHVVTSRHGRTEGPVDVALAAIGLVRNAAVVVPSFSTALSIAAATDMVALIPSSYFEHLRARGTLHSFPLPMPTEQITVSQMWHPRLDRDPAHRWLRSVVLEVCRPLNEPAKAP
ncbi:DNA-binding transcriptional LysR family regulator [Variovorax boronicumulans]|uniref:LysR family transcriptional regulator n=1 Tax=Variovorax boronicumulans TaxID=436515 RepID=UPI0027867309|nr:LysR family transcriptional regulator [Variovorax boronicumulans]MDP9991520.1 DNA-binding transcriptional LysR family regulator [Variovorax boronicumulans]MDQ0003548.1 DNA-binding transcriptional LysR family regulator [Variovorax boronicumulans]